MIRFTHQIDVENTMRNVKMPEDWNNAHGWEAYYASLYPAGAYKDKRDMGSIPTKDLPAVVDNLLENGGRAAWIPGCGLSPLPKLLALLGLDVHATDVSSTAVAYQQSPANNITVPKPEAKTRAAGTLTCSVHDFRQPYMESAFDLIINVKAFQAFPPETMRQVAQVHHDALKPGCPAYFDTMNVQGERRDLLEDSLADAGFFMAFHDLNRWYRRRLRETGIAYIFVLGQPMLPMTDAYSADKIKWEQDRNILRAVAAEYSERAEQEQLKEQQRLEDTDRIANVIYSTG